MLTTPPPIRSSTPDDPWGAIAGAPVVLTTLSFTSLGEHSGILGRTEGAIDAQRL